MVCSSCRLLDDLQCRLACGGRRAQCMWVNNFKHAAIDLAQRVRGRGPSVTPFGS